MRYWTLPALLAALLAALLVAGCATAPEAPPLTVYRLDLPTTVELPDYPTRPATVEVARTRAEAGYEGRGIVYQQRDHEIRYYTQSRWAEPPGRMIESNLVAALERSGMFRAVVRGPVAARADYRLESELLDLTQRFQGDASRVTLGLRLQLLAQDPPRVLATRVVRGEAAAPAEDAAGAVTAAHEALGRALAEAVRFVAETVAR